MLNKARKLFEAQYKDEQQYVGKKIELGGKRIKIESITGMRFKPTMYLINGKHEINMLRFYKQIHNAKDITEAQIEAFGAIELQAYKPPTIKDDSHGCEEEEAGC